ncbi:MAG: hypothetical protein MK102_11245 [Fuerstiella sp.]|nr:hypothetical protein [Fuerstiella sp.]
MLRSLFRGTSRDFLEWLLPSECLLCRAATESNPDNVPPTICIDCLEIVNPPEMVPCRNCGASLGPHADPSGKCPHCRGRRFCFKSVTCLAMYEGALQTLLLKGKWSSSSNNIRTLAKVFVDVRTGQLRSLNIDRIIPIPQIWHRRIMRNFNPAALFASEIGQSLKKPVDVNILRRSRGTQLQKRASVSNRRASQRNSFRIRDSHIVYGKRILLVDDVLTTGATCDEAVRMLTQAGVKQCHVAVLIRVPGHAA